MESFVDAVAEDDVLADRELEGVLELFVVVLVLVIVPLDEDN